MKIEVPAAELRLQSDAAAAFIAPTLKQLLACKRPRAVDVTRFLAAAKVFHELGRTPSEFQSADNVPVPVEVITMVGKLLTGTAARAAAQNAVRAQASARQAKAWQAKANEIWRHHPRLSKRAVCKNDLACSGRDNPPEDHPAKIKLVGPLGLTHFFQL